MALSHAYGIPPSLENAGRLLNEALDLGYDHLDTAALYGFGANESLIGETLADRREEFFLASKCGMTGVDGKRVIDGRPETLRRTIDEALTRLRTDRIDLYYLHRWDKSVPIEESVGELGRMVDAGKVLAIGLSEVSAPTLRRAHRVHPIAAVQNECSLWSRNAELGMLGATGELGIALVAFSPLGRGFLADAVASPEDLVERDIRRSMPRFQHPNFEQNHALLESVRSEAHALGISLAQLCLQWVLNLGQHVVAIPGTTSSKHLAENQCTAATPLDQAVKAKLDRLFAPERIAGHRYPLVTQAEIDTEEFA